MKRIVKIIAFAAVAALFASAFFSCAMEEGTSIEDQVNGFTADVKAGNYANLYTHFHPTQTAKDDQIKPATFWNVPGGPFPAGETYTFGALTVAGNQAVTKVTSTTSYSNTAVVFTMAEDDGDYMIQSLQIAGTTVVNSRIR